MPELPEVETVCNIIAPRLINNSFNQVVQNISGMRTKFPEFFTQRLINKPITNIWRRSKYIIIALFGGDCLVIHLGMTGNLYFSPISSTSANIDDKYNKHIHVVFSLEKDFGFKEQYLLYRDPRRFGLMDIIKIEELEKHKYFANLGPEPLTTDFNSAYLARILHNKSAPIKNILMNATNVVGIGNIYACEILYRSQISPLRLGKDINSAQIERLISNSKIVLHEAIKAGGSSISDYKNANQESGYFQNHFAVYGKSNQQCSQCTASIIRIVQAGRSSFYCAICQI